MARAVTFPPLLTPIRLVLATAMAAVLSGAFVAVAGTRGLPPMDPIELTAAWIHVDADVAAPLDAAAPGRDAPQADGTCARVAAADMALESRMARDATGRHWRLPMIASSAH